MAVHGGKSHDAIERKIKFLIENEGKSPKAATGQAYGMARHGDLGPAAKRAAGRKRGK